MSDQSLELTGTWDGVYFYKDVPEAGPATPFFATIKETLGAFTGTVIEPHELNQSTISASIIGHRRGSRVQFAKDYDDSDEYYLETVQYTGVLSSDGELIAGEWRIGHWAGRFEMTRTPSLTAKVEEEEAASVEF